MSTKAEIIEKLVAGDIEHDPSASKQELQALLPESGNESPPSETVGDAEVSDPRALVPKELPLVVKPTDGEWRNDAQAEYAKTLNAYAYRNPEKWAKKKDTLITQLNEIGKKPDALQKYQGGASGISYKDNRLAR